MFSEELQQLQDTLDIIVKKNQINTQTHEEKQWKPENLCSINGYSNNKQNTWTQKRNNQESYITLHNTYE